MCIYYFVYSDTGTAVPERCVFGFMLSISAVLGKSVHLFLLSSNSLVYFSFKMNLTSQCCLVHSFGSLHVKSTRSPQLFLFSGERDT